MRKPECMAGLVAREGLGWRLAAVLGGVLAGCGAAAGTEAQMDKLGDAVVVVSADDDTPAWGAGIVFARTRTQAYVVTANHVVRRGGKEVRGLRVKVRYWPDKPLAATLLDKFDPELDIAVLLVPRLPEQGIDCSVFPLDVLTNTQKLKRGDRVQPVGNPNGLPWVIPLQSEPIAAIQGAQITFQSVLISQGHSGGALLGNQELLEVVPGWVPGGDAVDGIVGMITRDQPPYGVAVEIGGILRRMREWGYPVQLTTAEYIPSSGFRTRFRKKPSIKDDPCLVNARDPYGRTPLQEELGRISGGNSWAAVKELLDAGADPNFTYPGHYPPVMLAVGSAADSVLEGLLDAGAKVSGKDLPVLIRPAYMGWVGRVRLLVSRGADVNATLPDGSTALHSAMIGSRNSEIISLLLAKGADPNARDEDGNTPLHAIGSESPGNPGSATGYEFVPGSTARAIDLLLKAGANLKSRNNQGQTPIDVHRRRDFAPLLRFGGGR